MWEWYSVPVKCLQDQAKGEYILFMVSNNVGGHTKTQSGVARPVSIGRNCETITDASCLYHITIAYKRLFFTSRHRNMVSRGRALR